MQEVYTKALSGGVLLEKYEFMFCIHLSSHYASLEGHVGGSWFLRGQGNQQFKCGSTAFLAGYGL